MREWMVASEISGMPQVADAVVYHDDGVFLGMALQVRERVPFEDGSGYLVPDHWYAFDQEHDCIGDSPMLGEVKRMVERDVRQWLDEEYAEENVMAASMRALKGGESLI